MELAVDDATGLIPMEPTCADATAAAASTMIQQNLMLTPIWRQL
jgi:hypothetical protein